MSTSLFLRPLPILLAAATLVACGSAAPSSPSRTRLTRRRASAGTVVGDTSILADVPIGAGWDVVGDAPILADVPIGAGWDVVGDARILADVPVGAGWDHS